MTERAKKLLLLYYKQSRKIRRVSGLPPLTFKAKKAGTLKNYRIYGNTVSGESVGDRTANLFDGTFIHRSVIEAKVGDDDPNRRSIVVDISNFNNGNKITFSRETGVGSTFQMYQVSSPLKGGVLLNTNNNNVFSGNSETLLATITLDDISNYPYLMIFLNGATKPITDEELLASKIMVNVGNTPLPYEPYGYRVPVTVEGKNLFDFGEWSKNINANDDNSLVKGIDSITITANSNDAFTTPYAYTHEGVYKIYVKPNTNYLLSWVSNNNLYGRVFIFKNGIPDGTHAVSTNNNTTKYLLFGTDADTAFITLRFGVEIAGNTITYSKIMLNEGSTALPYEPYRAPVTTPIYLLEPIKMVGDVAEYIDYAEQKQHRVRKNLLKITIGNMTMGRDNDDPVTYPGVTITINADKSITFNGRVRSTLYIPIGSIDDLKNGSYYLSGCPINGADNSYKLYVQNQSITSFDIGSGVRFNYISSLSTLSALIRLYGGYTCDNLTFYPMVRKASIEDDTYEPYITNTELDVTLPALPTLSGTNTLSVGTEVQPSNIEITGKSKE